MIFGQDKKEEKPEKFVRKKHRVSGMLTPEELKALDVHNERWTRIAFSTEKLDVPTVTNAMNRMYALVKQPPPRVVVVSSPMMLAYVYGASAAIWYQRSKGQHIDVPALEDLIPDDAMIPDALKMFYEAVRAATDLSPPCWVPQSVREEAIHWLYKYNKQRGREDEDYQEMAEEMRHMLHQLIELEKDDKIFRTVKKNTTDVTKKQIRQAIEDCLEEAIEKTIDVIMDALIQEDDDDDDDIADLADEKSMEILIDLACQTLNPPRLQDRVPDTPRFYWDYEDFNALSESAAQALCEAKAEVIDTIVLQEIHEAMYDVVNDALATPEGTPKKKHTIGDDLYYQVHAKTAHTLAREVTAPATTEVVVPMVNDQISAAIRAVLLTEPKADLAFEDHLAQATLHIAGKLGLASVFGWDEVSHGGAYATGPISYFTFYRDVLRMDMPEFDVLKVFEDCAMAPFRIPHAQFCLVSDFPEVLKVDERYLPHCEDGPSHRWRDGWELYHWHGVRIPGEWVTDKASLTPEIALTWPNIEQRRAACEIIGWHNILDQLYTIVVDTDDDPQIGQLLDVELPDIGRERFLKVECGTGRTFALPVPPNMRTALQANAWTYGLDGEDYKNLEVRT